jgi:hypothetical protein
MIALFRIAALAIAVTAQVPSEQPLVVPPHTPSQLLNRMYSSGGGIYGTAVPISCLSAPDVILRTPGFNPNEEAGLTAKIGPAYARDWQVCQVLLPTGWQPLPPRSPYQEFIVRQ